MRLPSKFTHGACPTCGTPRTTLNPAWLVAIRTQARVTQKDFAARCGVSQPYICDIEYGRRRCTPKVRQHYEALADAGCETGA